jgi:signal transduction histidine kinase
METPRHERGQTDESLRTGRMGIRRAMLERFSSASGKRGMNDRRGMGRDLYISKCIVEAHGGRIWAERTLGAGSAFHFTIPAEAGNGA